MVQAIINISNQANQTLNIVKAKFGLKDKSEAINMMAKEYGESILEPELRPDFIEKALKRQNESTIKIGTIENLKNRYE